MARQPAKKAETLKDNETLNGSNTLPAKVEFGPDKSVQLGEIVAKAHQASGLSVDAWNALPEAERDELLNKMIEDLRPVAEVASVEQTSDQDLAGKAAVITVADELQDLPQAAKPLESLQIAAIPNPEAYEALFKQFWDLLAGMDADLAEVALKEMQKAINGLQGASQPTLESVSQLMVSERVYIISAPGGPRRRAGLSFGPVPVELTYDQLGDDPDETLEALCADPFLKIDGRYEERPADETD